MTAVAFPVVLGVGSPIIDLLAPVSESFIAGVSGRKGGMELVTPGEMDALIGRLPEPPRRAPGGSAANTICTLAQLGMTVALLGKMGVDECAEGYRSAFHALGGDCSRFKTTAEKPTARCLSLITPDGERTMRTDLGAAMLLRPEEISHADFDGIRHVHLEGYALLDEALTQAVLDRAREHDCSISLDMGSFEVVRSVGDKLTCWLNEYVDMVFANEEEARAFCSDDNPKVGLDALGSLCRIAVVKVGAQGAWLQENGERVHVPALPVETVVDTTGAGDCWAGGFLYGYLNGLSLAQAGALAALTGAETVKNLGAAPDAAGWKQIREFATALSR